MSARKWWPILDDRFNYKTYENHLSSMAEAKHLCFQMPESAYASRYAAPTLTNVTLSGAVILPICSFPLSQRLAAKVGFYGANKIWINVVTGEAEVEDLNYPHSKYIHTRFAKAIAFLKFKSGWLKFTTHGSDIASEDYGKETVSEYFFLRYYDVFPRKSFAIDIIDKAFNCVRLCWDREEEMTGKL